MNRAKWNKGDYWDPKTPEIDVKFGHESPLQESEDEDGNPIQFYTLKCKITQTLPEYHEAK